MTEIRIVEVYGIKVDARAAALLEIVLDFGGSNSSHQRGQANTALDKLGELGATYRRTGFVTPSPCSCKEC